MGKTMRWLKNLFGMKKEKRQWSFARPGKDLAAPLGLIQVKIPVAGESEPGWLGNYLSETKKEQKKHAIAVAVDAAVAAAQVAVAVGRLTSHNKGFATGREMFAAAKIQAVFRGYSVRKELRALKGLVIKLQAHVRGYVVRKQATATLHRMQVLVRAQASARAHRARRFIDKDGLVRMASDNRGRKSMERFEEPKSEYHSKRVPSSYTTAKGCRHQAYSKCLFNKSKANKKNDIKVCHRSSFSGTFKMRATTKTKGMKLSSSLLTSKIRVSQAYIKCLFNKSTSNNKNDVKVRDRSSSNSSDVELFKRSKSERERAIAEAIAYCKQSQSKVILDS